jgi:FdhD protein
MKTINVKKYDVLQFKAAKCLEKSDEVVTEAPLQLYINFLPYTITMRTPIGDSELMCGLLYTEGIVRNWREKPEFEIIQSEAGITRALRLRIDPQYIRKAVNDNRSLITSSSCGVCGKRHIEDIVCEAAPVAKPLPFNETLISQLINTMQNGQEIFSATGACHAAAAFTSEGKKLSLFEDVGRHNAVDKVVGDLLMRDCLEEGQILCLSGRISYEIVLKAAQANFKVICAVSAPSSMAIDLAKEQGILLYGFCRDKRFTKYV